MTASIDRQQILAYRAFVQGLHRHTDAVGDLAILDLGAQDTPPGSAAQALAIRLESPAADVAGASDLATTWSLRGAPHLHRGDDLVSLSRALWPWSENDALARLDTSSSAVRSAGLPAREALRFVAGQIADIVTQPMPKGDVSTALTARLPAGMTVDCRRCKARHIVETLFRSAVLPAGIRFDPDERVVTFVPIPDWPGVPEESAGAAGVLAAYLRLLGPATTDDVAAFLGTRRTEVKSQWPEGLAEVDVAGERRWIPEEAVDALTAPPDPPAVRLLPPSDSFLQARDRDLVVPERSHQKVLWPILGRPGALLVHGEVTGAWRARKKGRRLDVTVQPFHQLPASTRRGMEQEVALLARVRGVADAVITID